MAAGDAVADIDLEPGHCERLYRAAAYHGIRRGRIRPGERISARLVPGQMRGRHGLAYCLETCGVEILRDDGSIADRVEFPRQVFSAFVTARAMHLIAAAGQLAESSIAYSLHATGVDEEPFPVDIPELPPVSLSALLSGTVPTGAPDGQWIATLLTAEVLAGFEALERRSRESGLEAAGRISTAVGYDAERRCFVRVLEHLVIAEETEATPLQVVSSAASWGSFLAVSGARGTQAMASVHTHVHLDEGAGGEGLPGEHLLESPRSLRSTSDPCISISDIVTHYTAFPDPLSAAAIVSVFPERRVLSLYGYTPGALLRQEPGYWQLGVHGAA